MPVQAQKFKLTFLQPPFMADEDGGDYRPTGLLTASLEEMPRVMAEVAWSNIRWDRVSGKEWRRRKDRFGGSSIVVVDVDDLGTRTEPDLVRQVEELGCPHVVMTTKTRGHYRVVLVPAVPMTDLGTHTATHTHYANLLGADMSCCDGVDWFRACRRWDNDDSGRLVSLRSDGVPLALFYATSPVIMQKCEAKSFDGMQAVDVSFQSVIDFLRCAEVGVAGREGDRTSFRALVAAGRMLHGLGHLDQLEALYLRYYNDRCEPPWTVKEVRRKVGYVMKYAEGWTVQPLRRKVKEDRPWKAVLKQRAEERKAKRGKKDRDCGGTRTEATQADTAGTAGAERGGRVAEVVAEAQASPQVVQEDPRGPSETPRPWGGTAAGWIPEVRVPSGGAVPGALVLPRHRISDAQDRRRGG